MRKSLPRQSPKRKKKDKPEPEPETKPEVEPEGDKEEEPDPKELARRGYEERKKVQAERRERVAKETQPYIDEAGDDEHERRIRIMEVREYNQTIEHNENTLVTEFERAKADPDLQMFNPENREQWNPALYNKVIKDYNNGYLTHDRNGHIIEIKGSLYEYLTETAEIYQGAIKSGQIKQVRAGRQMNRNAEPKPAAAPREDGNKDPILDTLTSD